jgi:hypothetical protein
MEAYNAAEKAGANALGYALDCGKHLSAANKTVTAAKGKWKSWREKNLPAVSEETERVYRRLAGAVAIKDDFFAGCKSIRDAIKHRSRFDDDLNLKPEKPKKPKPTSSSAAGLEPTIPAKGGLEADLQSVDADEIIAAIDADKLAHLAQASITKLSPDEVCAALTQAWDVDQLRDLVSRLGDHLKIAPHAPKGLSPAPAKELSPALASVQAH